MNRTEAAAGDMELRRRRLRFRAWHRGMREVDLILGRYADAELDRLDEAGIAGFEALLDLPDGDLLIWVMGDAVPAEHDSVILRNIIAFYRDR